MASVAALAAAKLQDASGSEGLVRWRGLGFRDVQGLGFRVIWVISSG